jgi:hypothetical protein
MMHRVLTLVVPLIAAFTLAGCIAGGRTTVKFDDTQYPVSLSPTVFGSDGEVLRPDGHETVGTLKIDRRAWSLVWGAVPTRKFTDLSNEINAQIDAAEGHAVVNLKIMARHCVGNYVIPLTLLPFYPGCVKLKIRGDIIREK